MTCLFWRIVNGVPETVVALANNISVRTVAKFRTSSLLCGKYGSARSIELSFRGRGEHNVSRTFRCDSEKRNKSVCVTWSRAPSTKLSGGRTTDGRGVKSAAHRPLAGRAPSPTWTQHQAASSQFTTVANRRRMSFRELLCPCVWC